MTSPTTEKEKPSIEEVLADKSLPLIYSNAYVLSIASTELLVVLKLGNGAVAKLLLPFPIAKALAQAIDRLLCQFEERVGQPIMHHDEIINRIQQSDDPPDPLTPDSPKEDA